MYVDYKFYGLVGQAKTSQVGGISHCTGTTYGGLFKMPLYLDPNVLEKDGCGDP